MIFQILVSQILTHRLDAFKIERLGNLELKEKSKLFYSIGTDYTLIAASQSLGRIIKLPTRGDLKQVFP